MTEWAVGQEVAVVGSYGTYRIVKVVGVNSRWVSTTGGGRWRLGGSTMDKFAVERIVPATGAHRTAVARNEAIKRMTSTNWHALSDAKLRAIAAILDAPEEAP